MLNKLRRIEKQSLDLWPLSDFAQFRLKMPFLPPAETKVKLTFTYSFIKQMSSESNLERESGGSRGMATRRGAHCLGWYESYARMRFLIYDKGTRKK